MFLLRKICLTLLCCLLLTGACLGADYTVTRLNTDVSVEQGGRYRVVQTAELELTAAEEPPVLPVAENAKKISVTAPVKADIFRKDGKAYVRLKLSEGFTGPLTVEIAYNTEASVVPTEQGQRMTVELVSSLWEVPTQRYAFTVVLPEETAAVFLNVVFHLVASGDADDLVAVEHGHIAQAMCVALPFFAIDNKRAEVFAVRFVIGRTAI